MGMEKYAYDEMLIVGKTLSPFPPVYGISGVDSETQPSNGAIHQKCRLRELLRCGEIAIRCNSGLIPTSFAHSNTGRKAEKFEMVSSLGKFYYSLIGRIWTKNN